jgi:hypothetical protein
MSAVLHILQERACNLAALNDFLSRVEPPARRKRAILSLWESDVISGSAAELLIEHHQLEAA